MQERPQYYVPGGLIAATIREATGEAGPVPFPQPAAPPQPAKAPKSGLLGWTEGNVGTTIYSVASTASSAALAYHGYKRNDSVGWAIGWFLLGWAWPIALPIAFAQGFAKPRQPKANGRSSRGRRTSRGHG